MHQLEESLSLLISCDERLQLLSNTSPPLLAKELSYAAPKSPMAIHQHNIGRIFNILVSTPTLYLYLMNERSYKG